MISREDNRSLAGAAEGSSARRKRIHLRLARLKKRIVVGTVVGFAAIGGLVAHHTVGVTAQTSSNNASQSSSAPPAAQAPDSGGFFGSGNNGGSGSAGIGGGGGFGPVLGSGGS